MTRLENQTDTILLVDDSPVNLKILGEMLRKDYKIRVATSGIKALEIAQSTQPPNLILLDIIMDDMDGYEVCRQLKENSKTFNIPVIFITSMDSEKDETTGLELGAVDYVTKPFSFPILKARIKTHLELKMHRDFFENLSNCDGLTGIPNRRHFDEVIKEEWTNAIHSSKQLALIMFDIDYFKNYNDHLGHISGDDCLKQVAKELKKVLRRSSDFLARYGGEEFCIVLPETDLEGASRITKKITQMLNDLNIPHPSSEVSSIVTCSMGAAVIRPTHDRSLVAFIEAADKCLYQAKNSGRNRTCMIDIDEQN
ncbi:MAG: diguanylate cyclase [Desulfobulbaceae bacterium]|nr:MAG: diguanylate cyclase [Desulfobulbaceae bacterium]